MTLNTGVEIAGCELKFLPS